MDILPLIPDKSVQLILADLPYGTTQCNWDSVLDLNKLWGEYKRIISDNGNILLFADEPFTSILITSNLSQFRQRITWDKQVAGNFLNAKKMLLKVTEDICLFTPSKLGNQTYNPQIKDKVADKIRAVKNRKPFEGGYIGKTNGQLSDDYDNKKSYPTNLLSFNSRAGDCNTLNRKHPTQKPIELLKEIILTYSNKEDAVLDNTMGVGTTCLGAKELNRSFIGIEKEVKYYDIACQRCGF
jgi:site-specific DNA-methyltransferase (adenine-specific)